MEKNLRFAYDQEGDVLEISIGKPRKAISNEIADDFFVRIDPKTRRIVGFSIINFKKKTSKKNGEFQVPIEAEFNL